MAYSVLLVSTFGVKQDHALTVLKKIIKKFTAPLTTVLSCLTDACSDVEIAAEVANIVGSPASSNNTRRDTTGAS